MNLKAILEDHNPWWRDPAARAAGRYPVRRELQDEVLRRLLDPGERRAMVVLGPRQVGKTTLFLQTADDLLEADWPPHNLTYFDFSDDRVTRPVSAREVVDLRPTGLDPDRPRAFLFDEVRLAPNWDRWLKQAVDRGDDRIAVTDSAASLLRANGRESGQGRWDEYPLEGLSFREFVRLQAGTGEPVAAAVRSAPQLLERYLALGGFPEHALAADLPSVRRRLRSDIVERAILRDLGRFVDSIEPIRDLFVYLVQDSGAIWNARARGSDLGRDERSIRRWLSLLEDTFLVISLPRHHRRPSAALRPRPKLYAADHGLIAAFSISAHRQAEHRGQLFEAVVFRHLRQAARELEGRLSYFRPRQDLEVDFVLETPAGRTAIEVTAGRRPKARKFRRLGRAAKELAADRTLLIHGALIEDEVEGIAALPLQRFLLAPIASVRGDGDG